MVYTIEAAREAGVFDEIMVSTDSEVYAKIAMTHGAKVPFFRPSELATDDASTWDVARDVIRAYEELGKKFDTVAVLQPTSPLRRAADIQAGYKTLVERDANLVVAVCEAEHSPLWSNILPEDLSLAGFLDPAVVKAPRQSLKKYYRINGALYIVTTSHLMKNSDLYDHRSYAVVMPKERSVDIDDRVDFLVAESLMRCLSD
jgi:CMP-N,N'-diacetyllegionaminic acid synthase